MAYARPLIATPKRRAIAMPGQFKTLRGRKIQHHAGGYWSPKALYKIIDRRSANSDYSNFIWLAQCSRCETVQNVEARALRIGVGCKVCKVKDKREEQITKRTLQAVLQAVKKEKLKSLDAKLHSLVASGLSAKQIALALGETQNRVVHRLRVIGLKTLTPKKQKGMILSDDGRPVADLKEAKRLTKERHEENKSKARVAMRVKRGMTPSQANKVKGMLKTGPKGPRTSVC